MKKLVEDFPTQLTEALSIGDAAKQSRAANTINNVLVCGLGGSGIGGSIVSELVAGNANVPVNVSKGYFIPAYVNENTLVIVSSYSGNTEETLQCMNEALDKGAKVSCVTSGGKVGETAKAKGLDCIIVPGGMPPRACLGYSLTPLFYILSFHGLIDGTFKHDFQAAVKLLQTEKEAIVAEAKEVAAKLKDKIPVIYSTTYNEGIAIRFRQQLNENAKVLCWHQVIPEMNHNELVGWTQKNDNLAVLFFLDRDEYSRNMTRVAINKEVIQQYAGSITELYSKGNSIIEKAVYFIHLGDWISVFLAEIRGVDAVEVNVINHLKSKLAEQ